MTVMNTIKTVAVAAITAATALFSSVLEGAAAPEGAMPFRRSEDFAPVSLGERRRISKQPLLFAEFQYKYGQYQNYLHYWIDRPLFCDRSLRPETFQYETGESFAVHAREVERAGLDGFNAFSIRGRKESIFSLYSRWLDEGGFRNLSLLPTVGYGEDGRTYANFENFAKIIGEARSNPRFPRINGVPVIGTYGYRVLKPEAHRELVGRLREKFGKDGFILPGDVDGAMFSRLKESYRRSGAISPAEADELDRAIEETLELSGGLQLSIDMFRRDFAGGYCTWYDYTFFDKCVLPVLEKVFARPHNAGKVLGFYVYQGYINHMSGVNLAEDCTGTLRRCLRSVLKANPDYLMFFEWNEVNENTMFQPTVWGGTLAPRILRWHSRLVAGLPPDPFPGDDVKTPTLALSYRATVKVGEELRFEILNVPDGVFRREMKVRLRVFDQTGRKVSDFPEETIDSTKFGIVEYLAGTAGFSGGEALECVLTVDGVDYRSFSPVRISPTVAWNYKSVRQHLRDALAAEVAELSVTAKAPRIYGFSCKAEFTEPLASLELVRDEAVHSALGAEKEYDFASNAVIRLALTTPSAGAGYGPLAVKVKNAKGPVRVMPEWRPNVNPGKPVLDADGCGFSVSAYYWGSEIAYYLQVPKSDATTAVLEVSRPMKGFRTAAIPLADIVGKGEVGAVLNDGTAFRVDARRVFEVPDLPGHVNSRSVDWSGETECRSPAPVFHFRAISKSGRIWRSRPFRPDEVPAARCAVPVFDEFSGRPVKVSMAEALVPKLNYRFDPASGAALVNGFDPFYNGHLGAGFFYAEAYSDGRLKVAPGDRSPKWVRSDGAWALEFDGVNDYINFPKEAFPQAAFTLGMEIKADFSSVGAMTLFRHYAFTRGSLSVFSKNGKLFCTWGDKILTREPRIETPLAFRDGEWNRLSVSYDFERFTFVLNGEKFEYPWKGRPWRFMQSIFGGHDKLELATGADNPPKYFKGQLRRLVIRHR